MTADEGIEDIEDTEGIEEGMVDVEVDFVEETNSLDGNSSI